MKISKVNSKKLLREFHFHYQITLNNEPKLTIYRHIVLINQPLVIVVSHKIIVHNLELIINSNIF